MTQSAQRFVKLRVHAGARKSKCERKAADTFEIWTKAPAERGLANAEALAAAAAALGVEAKTLRLIKGAHSPSKIVEIIA
jgi:uncharacterized protein YggU (UPF0235/DUF167 family)